MKIRSIRTNYILNVLRIISSTFIGVFTMPYINNVLGPSDLGKVEYANSIVTYFILFSALGIPVYGIRQIAKIRDNAFELGKTLIEILCILFSTTIIAYLILFSILFGSNIFINYQDLIILMSSMIILNNLGAEWFFQGIEDQLYITIRYLIVRIITVILLFVLVKTSDDYMYYALIVVLNFCGSNFLNFFRLRKYVTKEHFKFSELNFIKHIKPSLTIFIASISVSIYLQIDTFLLGYLSGTKSVGLYSVANKLLRYVITFIVSIGAVLLPRLSNLWGTNKEAYYDYLQKSFHFLVLVSIPFSLYFFFFSKEIIHIMAGEKFYEAILTLKILSPICFLVAMAYFFGYLVLYTQGNELLYTYAVSISAVVSIGLNFILIKKFQQNGAAITQLISEVLGILIIVIFIKNKQMLKLLISNNFYKIVFVNALLLMISLVSFNFFEYSSVFFFILYSILFFSLYFIFLIFVKENIITYLYKFITHKIFNR